MNFIDTTVQMYLSNARTEGVTEFMYLLTTIFDLSASFIFIALCLILLIYLVRGKRYAILFSVSLLSGVILVFFLKPFFDVGRPLDNVINTFGKSFPSYHATITTIFFLMLAYIFDNYFKSLWRIVFNIFCVFSILAVSFSRIYLGAHWLSDVLAGILLGILVSYFWVKIFNKYSKT